MTITNIEPLRNNVIVRDIEVGEKVTHGGIIILDDNGKNEGIRPRKCLVYKVGKDVDYVKPGETIIVSHARWTRGVEIESNGEKFKIHMIDTKDILVVLED